MKHLQKKLQLLTSYDIKLFLKKINIDLIWVDTIIKIW